MCQYSNGEVRVELDDPKLLGVTHFKHQSGNQFKVATEVDSAMFFREYFAPFSLKQEARG